MHIDKQWAEKKRVAGKREIAIDTNACLNSWISPVEVNSVVGYKRQKIQQIFFLLALLRLIINKTFAFLSVRHFIL